MGSSGAPRLAPAFCGRVIGVESARRLVFEDSARCWDELAFFNIGSVSRGEGTPEVILYFIGTKTEFNNFRFK